jgi:hypothetical protein
LEVNVTEVLGAFARHLANRSTAYLGGIVALSTFSMAILQTSKDLLPIRRLFHRWFLKKWFEQKCGTTGNPEAAEKDLVDLATDGDRNAFYDLAIEQLCGQITAAAQIVLEYPGEHAELLQCLTAQGPNWAIANLTKLRGAMRENFESLKAAGAKEEMQSLGDAKTRMLHQVQRSVDGLQISATYRWKLYWQLASFVFSVMVAMVAIQSQRFPWSTSLFIGLSAGFLAPVARDLQAKLQQVK